MSERKTRIVRQLRNGQITIPKEFREAMHLDPDDLLSVTLEDGHLSVTAAQSSKSSAWRDLYDLFAPTREAISRSGLSEQEINDAINEALRAYRAEEHVERESA